MVNKQTFRLYILGHLEDERLITLAEFKASRAVERVQISPSKVDDLSGRIRKLRSFIEAGYPSFDEHSLKKLGRDFFDLIIIGDVKRLFDMATGQKKRFLPFEIFVEDYDVASWPWEYLYDSTMKMFICQEFHPISRGIFTFYSGEAPATKNGKIRILFVIGVPPDDPKTTPEEEKKWISEVFKSLLANHNIEMNVKEMIGPDELERELQNRYDILHFYGHAGFDLGRREGYLKFIRPNTKPFPFYANSFGQLLAEQGIRLVFLNACETAKAAQSDDPARSSVAAALLGRGIPAVIATQFSMPDTSAHFFSSIVYNSLVTGKTIIEALRDGRRSMCYAEEPKFFDWGIPVLYSFDPNHIIFPRPKKQRQPKWFTDFDKAVKAANVIKSLMVPKTSGGPTISVERTVRSPHKESAKVRVALIDIDSKVGFLPDLVVMANKAQPYYDFQVVYLPIPSGAVRTDFENYLFCWDEIPGNDSGRFIEFLDHNFGVNWVKTAKIEKLDEGKKIKVSSETNSLSLRLNNEKTKAILTIDDRAYEFIAKMEKGKLNIKESAPPQTFLPRLEEYLESKPQELKMHLVCCLTSHLVAGEENDYMFCWDEIPGNDSGRFIEFLDHNFGVNWVKTAKIEKLDEGKMIKVSSETNSLSLRLNNEKTKTILTINDGKADEFVAKIENGRLNIYNSISYWNHFAAPLGSNEKVFVMSTFGLREYSEQAKVSFAKATLYICLAMLIVTENQWGLGFHDETVGCLFDYCRLRDDIVEGLRNMRFDHIDCRNKIMDSQQLMAIDALIALEIPLHKPPS